MSARTVLLAHPSQQRTMEIKRALRALPGCDIKQQVIVFRVTVLLVFTFLPQFTLQQRGLGQSKDWCSSRGKKIRKSWLFFLSVFLFSYLCHYLFLFHTSRHIIMVILSVWKNRAPLDFLTRKRGMSYSHFTKLLAFRGKSLYTFLWWSSLEEFCWDLSRQPGEGWTSLENKCKVVMSGKKLMPSII